MSTRSALIPVVVGLLVFPLLLGGCNEDKIEKALGGQISRAIESTYHPVDDPALQDWLSYVGHTTVGMSTRQHIPYDFTVLDSDTVNAMAAPWGHVYFMRGLLDFAEDEDEVWMVMGHEVGHVVHRDVIKAVKRTFLWNLGLAAVSTKSRGMAEALGVGLGLLSFHYSRGDEYDADRAGVIHTYRAGHDPRAGMAFFVRLMEKYEKHKPSKIEALLRTHPLTSARIDAIKRRPECDPNNAEALAWIGRGYALRGRHVEGMRLLREAVKLDPKLAEARLALAEAAERRGYLALAQEQLQACADVLGYVPSVERRVQVVEATQPQQWPEYSAEERQQVSLAATTVTTK
ncbi:MAG: M48 family metalloprotease, partial [Armatimonadetes bacterium]|nr:M48 family metalloprotease [Armatimonadota bacterium]